MEQLMKMSMENTEKYRKYKCGVLKKARAIPCIGIIVSMVFITAMAFLGNQNINKKFLAVMIVVSIIMMLAYSIVIEISLKGLRNENFPYEYVFTTAVMDKTQKLQRENGEEVTYKIRTEKGRSFTTGHQIVIVYVPDGKRIYAETIENWKRIGME